MKFSIKSLTQAALFCALCVIGANIKITGSVALDALPAYLAAMLFGGPVGALTGFFGHMVSAMLSGFPLSLPLHIAVALEMAAICYITGVLAKDGGKRAAFAAVLAFILNGFVSPAILIIWPGMGITAYLAFVLPLALASGVNAFFALALYYPIKKVNEKRSAVKNEKG